MPIPAQLLNQLSHFPNKLLANISRMKFRPHISQVPPAVPLLLLALSLLFSASQSVHAQRMPQDSWYLAKEFRGDIEGGKFYNPTEVAIGPDSLIYVTDRYNHQVQVFDLDGNFIRKWGSYGTQAGFFNEPTSIFVDANGLVYVCDYNNRIQVFNNTGKLIRAIGEYGTGPGKLNRPHGITVDLNGDIYVCEYGSSRISVFQSDGTFLRTWGTYGTADGQFQGPVGLCMTLDGRIAVLEGSGCRVQIFEKSGIFLSKFGTYGNDAGKLLSPHGIDTDSSGNFYVGQHYSDRITVFSSAGSYIRVFGSEGTGNGQFDNPFGLAIASNKVYVADNYNNRIAIFTLNGSWIKNFGSHGKKEFSYLSALAKDEEDNYYLVDSGNREIRKLNKHFDFLLRFGSAGTGNGQFSDYSAAATSSGEKLYVTDTNNHRVQIFDKNGNFLGKFGAQGTGNGQFQSPQGICVAENGNVYVADTGNYRIQVFDKEGQFLLKFGKYGSFDGDFSRPDSIAISPSGEIAVSDNGRTQIFTPNGEWVRKMNISGTLSYGGDGLIYLGSSGVFSGVGEGLKYWWLGNSAIETAEGDILANYSGTSARIWKRTYRTVHSEPSNALPLPSILSQKRRPGTSLVDVEYTVKDADNSTVQTAALAFKNGGNSLTDVIPITSFAEGTANKLGTNIATGQTHKFTWDVSRDWSTDFGEVQLEMLAKDGRGLLNLDFIQIPATGNLTALKISRSPLNDNDFLSVWYYLIASSNNKVRLINGEVYSNDTTLEYDGSFGAPGLVANYHYGNTSFSGNASTQIVQEINIPITASTGNMSIRWTGTLMPQETGYHRIYLKADHSAKLFINNSQWFSITSNGTAPAESSTAINLTAGTPVAIKVEYTDNGGSRNVEMTWQLPSGIRRTLSSPYLFTGVQSESGSVALNARLAYGTTTTPAGRKFIFSSMGLREATAAEVLRAKEAGTPGVINRWEPKLRVGPDERPSQINAYGFDTGGTGYWVVPVTETN